MQSHGFVKEPRKHKINIILLTYLYSMLIAIGSVYYYVMDSYMLFALLMIPGILAITVRPKRLLYAALLFMYVFPKAFIPNINLWGNAFSWGLADIIFIVMLFVLILDYLSRKQKDTYLKADRITVLIMWFYLIQVPSFVMDVINGISITSNIANMVKYVQPAIIYLWVVRFLKDDLKELERVIIFIVICVNVIAIVQINKPDLYKVFIDNTINSSTTINYIETFMYGRIASTMMNPGTYAWFLSLAIPFSLYMAYKETNILARIISWFALVSSIILLIYTESRTQWIAVLIELAYFTLKDYNKEKRTRLIFIGVILACLGFYIYGNYYDKIYTRLIAVNMTGGYSYFGIRLGDSGAARVEFFKAGLLTLKKNFILGTGALSLPKALGESLQHSDAPISFLITQPTVHNQYLTYLIQMGIPFGIMAIVLLFKIVDSFKGKGAYNSMVRMMFLGLTVSCIAGDVLNSSRILSFVFLLISISPRNN